MEITKAYKVTFMIARNSLAIRYRQKLVKKKKKKKQNMVEIYFFKSLANTSRLSSKSCSWFNKVVQR